jgi:hypothetical protein
MTNYPHNTPTKEYQATHKDNSDRIILISNKLGQQEVKFDCSITTDGVWLNVDLVECETNWYTEIVLRIFSYISVLISEELSPGVKTMVENYEDKE